MPKRMFMTTACLAAVALAAGCVPQDKYDNLLTAHRALTEENINLKDRVEESESTNRMLQERLGMSEQQLQQVEVSNQQLRGEIDDMAGNYASLESRLDNMNLGPLPGPVNRALQQLADQYPGLLMYDASQGMVRFASDLTFDLGSAQLKAQAQESLVQLAKILNDATISGYEVEVVGHTDSVPIVSPATRAQHPSNLHLSVHRAISVAGELKSAGVDPRRIQVAGYGEHRPIVAEGAGGARENRRVELFIVPMRGDVETSPAAPSAGASTAAPDEPMK